MAADANTNPKWSLKLIFSLPDLDQLITDGGRSGDGGGRGRRGARRLQSDSRKTMTTPTASGLAQRQPRAINRPRRRLSHRWSINPSNQSYTNNVFIAGKVAYCSFDLVVRSKEVTSTVGRRLRGKQTFFVMRNKNNNVVIFLSFFRDRKLKSGKLLGVC